jgi:uncharacterized membrane protein YqjE
VAGPVTERPGSSRPASGGLSASLLGLSATLLAIFQTRLALLATEIEEEKRRFLSTMAWSMAAVLMGCMALVFSAAFLTVLWWDTHRLLVLGCAAGLFACVCAAAVWHVRGLLASPPMLEATLAELEADRQALSPTHTPPA